MIKIVADKNIPFVEDYFKHLGELILVEGRSLTRDDLLTADVLLVRSVTPVGQALLKDTAVKFVGSATSGKDHLDTSWLSSAGIEWFVAEGCNSQAVTEYIICIIAALQKLKLLPEKPSLRAAVVGVGRIGREVVRKLQLLGFEVIQCDPLRALIEKDFVSVPFDELTDVDLITFHTPLTYDGQFPTYHMADKKFLQRQKKNCVLVNTSRGEVIDSDDLKMYGRHLYWCLDVWEHEPYIDLELLESTLVATPHIAGYTVEGKRRGTDMLYRAISQYRKETAELPSPVFHKKTLFLEDKAIDWRDIALHIFDPRKMTQLMQEELIREDVGIAFDKLRKNFIERFEFANIQFKDQGLMSIWQEIAYTSP